MDRDADLRRLQAIEREMSELHAERADLLVRVAGSAPVVEELLVLAPRPDHDEERRIRIEDAAREEIACALRWSPATAHLRIDEARLLAGPLRGTAVALRAGAICAGHVTVIAEAARRLPGRHATDPDEASAFADACSQLEDRVLPTARRSTIAQTRRVAQRAVLAIDARGAARRHREARCTRDVRVIDELDGISTLIARMATPVAHAVLSAVQQAAEDVEPGASAGERRAEALADLVLRRGAHDAPAVQVTLDVVVPLDALLEDHAGVADLDGAALPLAAVRDIVADPSVTVTLRRLVTDPVTGHLLDRSRRCYEIPAALREFIVARDGHCRFPGCGRRAASCQVDHAVAFDDGGETSARNLGLLCVRHHQLKTHACWDLVESRADGSCTWRSPTGRRYPVEVRRILADPDPPPF